MFTYTLSGKAIENGQNRITVDYSNGIVKCTETFFFVSKEDLDNRITNKIKQLENVVALDASLVTTGYVKAEKIVEPVAETTPLQLAEQKLYELKRKIDLGVLEETDQEFVDAVTTYKLAETGK